MTFTSKAQTLQGIVDHLSRVMATIENKKSTVDELNQAQYEFMAIKEKISELSQAYNGKDDWLSPVKSIVNHTEDLFTKTFSHRYIF